MISKISKLAHLFNKLAISTLSDQTWLFNINTNDIFDKASSVKVLRGEKFVKSLICKTFDYIFDRFNFESAEVILNNIHTKSTNLYVHDLIHYVLREGSVDDINAYNEFDDDNYGRFNSNLYFEEDLVDKIQIPDSDYNKLADGASEYFTVLFENTMNKMGDEYYSLDYSNPKKFELLKNKFKHLYEEYSPDLYKKEYDIMFNRILEAIKSEFKNALDDMKNNDIRFIISKSIKNSQIKRNEKGKKFVSDEIHGAIRLWLKLLDRKLDQELNK